MKISEVDDMNGRILCEGHNIKRLKIVYQLGFDYYGTEQNERSV